MPIADIIAQDLLPHFQQASHYDDDDDFSMALLRLA